MTPFVLFLAFLHVSLSFAKTVTYDFDVGWVSAAPDGFVRPVIGINGQWPNPTIEANVNDTIVVNLRNSLGNESTSLHFHGMWQQGSGTSDGPVGVAQCTINPGQSYTYTFKAYPAGTHWYHSHTKGQYPDGLRGKMIIHDTNWEKSLKIDEQIYLSMSDWYHTQQPFLINQYLSPDNRNGNVATPDSFLFNDARKAPEFVFEPGKRYLLRIVSFSALACGQFHIEGHPLSVVAIDGVPTHPKDATTIIVCAGQSYDVVVTGKENANNNVQYIAKMSPDMLTGPPPRDEDITVIGEILYEVLGSLLDLLSGLLDPSWKPDTNTILNDMTLTPLDDQPLLKNPQSNIVLRTNQTYYEGIGSRIGLGDQPWTEPKVPSLYTALSTGEAASQASTYGIGTDPWVIKSGHVVQVYMENPQVWPHPMHLHGHVFQVVSRGAGSWDGNEGNLPAVPMKRDNVVIPANGYVVLRFRADNPGVWFFHCHIDLHLVGGMAATFIEAPEVLQATQSIPAAGVGLCAAVGKVASGNCAGQQGAMSWAQGTDQCNTIFNSKAGSYGALVYPPS
ncbi:hypothetical protein BS50DRAFT_36444 [Corynespora cassiicola Philippines]|uniref:Multicopper oxidase n=1 Tax=Corynespora cassiicola Philippines TaxID=1448308 RepID=A0A2T2PC57_CORCC|nr:hypothetical protein BS50DRAFT_36444 [Corynespora cassiicola Philippines]